MSISSSINPSPFISHTVSPFPSYPRSALDYTPEKVIEALTNNQFEWIKDGILDGKIDPKMKINLLDESAFQLFASHSLEMEEETFVYFKILISKITEQLKNSDVYENKECVDFITGSMSFLLVSEHIFHSSLPLEAKEKCYFELWEKMATTLKSMGLKSLNIPFSHAAEMKSEDLSYFILKNGGETSDLISVECDSSKISREAVAEGMDIVFNQVENEGNLQLKMMTGSHSQWDTLLNMST